jgi:hypothetical protein
MGQDAIQLDDVSFVRALAHEGFHAYQFTRMGGMDGLPDFVQAVDEGQALEHLAEQNDLDHYQTSLGRALRVAIEAETDAEAREALTRFLDLRREWRATQPAEITTFEQSTEWLEGATRYSDTHLTMLAGREIDAFESLMVAQGVIEAYPEPDETRRALLDQLADPTQIPGGLRDRYYVLGAGQCLLLDRFMPNWQAQVMPGGTPLEALLEQALTVNR